MLKLLFNLALESKIYNYREFGTLNHPFWDFLIFNKVKKVLGGKIRAICVGGAPMDKQVLEFLRVAL